MDITYSNSRTNAVVDDWPYGTRHTEAHFWVEADARYGQRACRTTRHPKTGKESLIKRLTWARQVRIVDGSDGHIYLAHLYNNITIMQGNMLTQYEVILEDSPRFSAVRALFDIQ